LNNHVEYKEYQLRKNLREKKPYSIENIAEYVVDESAHDCIKLAGGLNKSTSNLHESIQLPSGLSAEATIDFAILNNYHDLVSIDPEE
jgi:hypothetical protein